MRPLKVYGVTSFLREVGQVRLIVAARTKAEAIKLTGVTRYHFNDFASETGNAVEVAVATAAVGTVFYRISGLPGKSEPQDYKPVPIR